MGHNLCVIPARGGSKRIPRKNIKDFLGKPIIAYSIETAIQSGVFDQVMVSTDDEEIAHVASKFGASVPFMRSARNADDFVPTIAVIKEVVDKYEEDLNLQFAHICCIFPTAPMVTKEQLIEGLSLIKDGFNSVFPVVAYGHPIWRGLMREGKETSLIWKEYANTRSQDLQKVFHDAGQWYWLNAKNLPDALLSENSASIELAETEVQDIDNLVDWELAELKYNLLYGSKGI